MHASSIKKSSHQVQQADIGATTTEYMAEIIQKHQPLTWHYLHAIAKSESRGERPISGVGVQESCELQARTSLSSISQLLLNLL